jgi:hypothetical protein
LVSELNKKDSTDVPMIDAIESSPPSKQKVIGCNEIAEDGFFDLILIGQNSFRDLKETSNRIAKTTTDLGNKLAMRARETDAAKTQTSNNAKAIQQICNRAAEDLESFVEGLNADVPTFAKLYKMGIDSYSKAYGAGFEEMKIGDDDLNSSLNGIISLKVSLIDALKKIKSFREVMSKIPSATRTLIRSRKHVVESMDEFIREFETAIDLTTEMEKIIVKRIEEKKP